MKTNDRPLIDDAVTYLAGELPADDCARFEDQLASDSSLRTEIAELESVRNRLLALPEVEPSPELTSRILDALRAEKQNEAGRHGFLSNKWQSIAALSSLAACAALAFVGVGKLFTPKEAGQTSAVTAAIPDPHREKALDWLVARQDADGSWNVSRWGGSPKFQVALTALSALALLESGPQGDPRLDAATRACAWLASQQTPDGTFGPSFQGAPYNHAMATMALLRAQRLAPDDQKKSSLDRAIAAITRRQLADGAWGYQSLPFRGDHSITEWHLAALEQASGDGWSGLESRTQRARAWMQSRPRRPQTEAPDSFSETLARADSRFTGPDLYAAYFRVRELLQNPSADSLDRLAILRQSLHASQESAGALAGSWPPQDRWSAAGGRLYSTAMATLALANR